MSNDKRNTIIIILTYLFTTFITQPIDSTLGMASYNPFVDGFHIKLLISLGLWIVISLIVYFVLSRFLFKETTKKEN